MAENTSSAALTACAAVLGVNELLEKILLELDMMEIIKRANRVSQQWHTLIDTSPSIKRLLFLEPETETEKRLFERWLFDETIYYANADRETLSDPAGATATRNTCAYVSINDLSEEEFQFAIHRRSTDSSTEAGDDNIAIPVRLNPLLRHTRNWSQPALHATSAKLQHQSIKLEKHRRTPGSWEKMYITQPPAAREVFMRPYNTKCKDGCRHRRLSRCDIERGPDVTIGEIVDAMIAEERAKEVGRAFHGSWDHMELSMGEIVVPTDEERRQVEINTRGLKLAYKVYKEKAERAQAEARAQG